MATASYIISITSSSNDLNVVVALLNLGSGQPLYGQQRESKNTNIRIVRKSTKARQDVITELLALPTVSSVLVVPLSNPVKRSELTEVRELFAAIGWDDSEVSDEDLSLFINDKLQNQYTYYIDVEHGNKRTQPVKIYIKLLEKHPHFSPEWLKKTANTDDDIPTRKFTIDDLQTQTFIAYDHEVEEPPPPPLPPHNLEEMTDTQISEWIRKNVSGDLKNGIIEIKRTPGYIYITLTLDELTEIISYRVKI